MSSLVETMFYLGKVPWHGDGIKLDQPPTSKEAIVQAGLDWRVETQPIYMQDPISTLDRFTEVPEGKVVIRASDNKVLGVVGPRWTPVQNEDAFNFFDPLVQDGMAVYHTAGSLRGGRIVWVLAQIGENRNIIGDDNVGQFLLLSMGHDGTRGIQLMPTPIRVVCANTLSAAERAEEGEQTLIKIHHTTNAVTRLNEIGSFIKPYLACFDETTEVFRLMAKANVTSKDVGVYLQELFPDPKKKADGTQPSTAFAENVRAVIQGKFEGDLLGYEVIPKQFQSTYWTLYNAVTEYIDHERGTDKNRAGSMWMGGGKQIKERALEMACVGAAE